MANECGKEEMEAFKITWDKLINSINVLWN